jgi:lipid-binding SYLF domain-containing protein
MVICGAMFQRYSARALALIATAALTACATTDSGVSPSAPDALVINVQTTLGNFLRDPNQTWVQQNIDRAKAVLIAPNIVKAGFIFGGSGGRAVLVSDFRHESKFRRP